MADDAQDLHQFTSGAKSSGKLPSYHLIPWEVFADRLAVRYMEGAAKYGEGNWESGLNDRQFIADRANHMLEHAHKAVRKLLFPSPDKYPTDDDLSAVIWGAIFLMAAQNRAAKSAHPRVTQAIVPADTRVDYAPSKSLEEVKK